MNAIVVVTKFSTWLMGVHHAGELLGGAALSPRKRDASFPLSRAIHCHELKFAKRRASHLCFGTDNTAQIAQVACCFRFIAFSKKGRILLVSGCAACAG